MGQKEKLIQRLKTKPKDFTFDDAKTLLKYLDYICSNKGKMPKNYWKIFMEPSMIILKPVKLKAKNRR